MGIGSEIYIITEVVVADYTQAPEVILCKPYGDYQEARHYFENTKAELIRQWQAYGYNIDIEPDYVIAVTDDGYYNCFEFRVENIL